MSKGILIVVSAPAGCGKDTILEQALSRNDNLFYSVSATSRAMRPGETDGVSYHFRTREQFESMIENGELLEYTEYCGNYYGTLKSEADRVLSQGHDLILEIETDGAMQVKRQFPDAVTVMLLPPDGETLEARLRGRGTETDDIIRNRLSKAREEILLATKYDYVVVNEDGGVDACAASIAEILRAEHHRPARMKHVTDTFFK